MSDNKVLQSVYRFAREYAAQQHRVPDSPQALPHTSFAAAMVPYANPQTTYPGVMTPAGAFPEPPVRPREQTLYQESQQGVVQMLQTLDARTQVLDTRTRVLDTRTRVLARGIHSTNTAVDTIAKATGLKTVDFKPKLEFFKNVQKPTKVIANEPTYRIRTPEGHKAYQQAMEIYEDWPDAEQAALDTAKDVDEDVLAGQSAAGGAGGSAPDENERMKTFINLKSTAEDRDTLGKLHALIDSMDAIPLAAKRTRPLKGELVKIYKQNRDTYGFGLCETMENPFIPAGPADVASFEQFKQHWGFPAGVWDGKFNAK